MIRLDDNDVAELLQSEERAIVRGESRKRDIITEAVRPCLSDHFDFLHLSRRSDNPALRWPPACAYAYSSHRIMQLVTSFLYSSKMCFSGNSILFFLPTIPDLLAPSAPSINHLASFFLVSRQFALIHGGFYLQRAPDVDYTGSWVHADTISPSISSFIGRYFEETTTKHASKTCCGTA